MRSERGADRELVASRLRGPARLFDDDHRLMTASLVSKSSQKTCCFAQGDAAADKHNPLHEEHSEDDTDDDEFFRPLHMPDETLECITKQVTPYREKNSPHGCSHKIKKEKLEPLDICCTECDREHNAKTIHESRAKHKPVLMSFDKTVDAREPLDKLRSCFDKLFPFKSSKIKKSLVSDDPADNRNKDDIINIQITLICDKSCERNDRLPFKECEEKNQRVAIILNEDNKR